MNSKLVTKFTTSAGWLLFGMALANLIGNQGAISVQPLDPVLMVSTRYLFWSLAALEIVIAAICLFGKSVSFQNISVLWLVGNLILYRLFLLYVGVKSLLPYYDTMANNFGISAGAVNILFGIAIIYLCLGSGLSLFLLRKESKQREASAAQTQTNIVQA